MDTLIIVREGVLVNPKNTRIGAARLTKIPSDKTERKEVVPVSTGGSYRQVYVQCPFYLGDNGLHQIRCEGFGDAKFVAQV